ncbi:hypothetical protein PRIC1_011903 [Phytophthora ramorum]
MAKAPSGDNASSNPFDAHSSGRDPFPSFAAALANEWQGEQTEEQSALDWSIDTLAELKPVLFSPLPQQKDAGNTSGSPHGASGFFEDEAQYGVLRTPLPAARPVGVTQAGGNRSRAVLTFTPSPTPHLELHRRCRETIDRCEARLRERQRKTDKLQAALHPPTPQRLPRQRETHQHATPPRPAKRNRLSFVATPSSEMKTPGTRPPKWSASPIAMVGSRHFDALTPSPLVNTPRTTKQSSKMRLFFGLSPIAFPSPGQTAQAEKSEEGKDEEKAAVSDEGGTLPLSSTNESAESASPESEKENGDQQAQRGGGRDSDESSSSHATQIAAKKAPMMRASIPQRQKAFMEAIEAEAHSSESSAPRTTAPSSSILSLYQEAKQLGMTDPQTQWQHVQLLRQNDQKHKPER